uniref:hypothetical protein n=1 Tax=Nonomuraea sp. CA-251285 TaxID=3240002 RepID=UPI003F4959D4
MDLYFWTRGPVPEFTPTSRCRHCAAGLAQLPSGVHVDADGFTACVKAPIATVAAPGFHGATHEPMPAGLEGPP